MTGEMSAMEVIPFVIIGTFIYTFGVLFLFGRCLNMIAAYFKLSEKKKEEQVKSIKIQHGTAFTIVGFVFIIVPLSHAFSWVIGVGAGLLIGTTIFTLIYLLMHKRSKK